MILTFRKPSELSKQRPPVFCQDFVPIMQSAVSMLYAGGGTGKSYAAIRMGIKFCLETKLKAALWLTEDSEGENRFRFDSIVNQEFESDKRFLNDNIIFIPSRPIQLTKLDGGNASLSESFWQIRLELADYDLIVIDPLLQFNGCDENSNTHAGVLMGALKEWTDEERKSIVLIHHATKSKEGDYRPRGAGEWTNGCRSVFKLEKIADNNGSLDLSNKNNLKFSLVKDNGLSYFFRNQTTGEIEKGLRVFPEYEDIVEKPKGLFISLANHNNAKDPSGFLRVNIADFNRIHEYITDNAAYSQYEFKDFYRKGENNLGSATMIFLDFDSGLSIAEAKKKFAPVQHCIVTTRSHQKEKSGQKCDRFRVVLPLESPLDIPLEDYPHFLDALNKRVGGDVDPSTKDLARFYFASPKDAEYWYGDSVKRMNWKPVYNEMKKDRVKLKIEKRLLSAPKKEYQGEPQNTLPEDTYFDTNRGNISFASLRDTLSVGEQVTCKCHDGYDHGDLGPKHHSAFIKKHSNGNVFYSCSGGRCQHIGTLWCANWKG